MSDSLRPHESQHARPPCPSQTPGVYSNSCPWSQWCHPAISSSVVPFSFCPPIPPSIRVFSNESTLRMRWPKYWSFSFSISPSNEHPGLISFRMDQGLLLGEIIIRKASHAESAQWPTDMECVYQLNSLVAQQHLNTFLTFRDVPSSHAEARNAFSLPSSRWGWSMQEGPDNKHAGASHQGLNGRFKEQALPSFTLEGS